MKAKPARSQLYMERNKFENEVHRLEKEIKRLKSLLRMFTRCPGCAGGLTYHPLDHKPDCPYLKASKE